MLTLANVKIHYVNQQRCRYLSSMYKQNMVSITSCLLACTYISTGRRGMLILRRCALKDLPDDQYQNNVLIYNMLVSIWHKKQIDAGYLA